MLNPDEQDVLIRYGAMIRECRNLNLPVYTAYYEIGQGLAIEWALRNPGGVDELTALKLYHEFVEQHALGGHGELLAEIRFCIKAGIEYVAQERARLDESNLRELAKKLIDNLKISGHEIEAMLNEKH